MSLSTSFSPTEVYTLPVQTHSVYEAMALDERMLEEAEVSGGIWIRLYQMQEPSLTLGYFQRTKGRHLPPIPWTRRPTGGGLVHHLDDWVLSVAGVLPSMRDPVGAVYQQVHQVLLHSFRDLVPDMAMEMDPRRCSRNPESECFTRAVQYDLLSGGQKVVGGALCKRRHAFLYQGSLQWKMTEKDMELHTHALYAGVAESWQGHAQERTVPVEWSKVTARLAKQKYATDAWRYKL